MEQIAGLIDTLLFDELFQPLIIHGSFQGQKNYGNPPEQSVAPCGSKGDMLG